MIVPVLILLFGTRAMAAPAQEDQQVGVAVEEEVYEGDMILSTEQKEMLKKSIIKTDDDQAKANKEAKKEKELLTAGEEDGKNFLRGPDVRWPGNTLWYDLSQLSSWNEPEWNPLGIHNNLIRKIRSALEALQKKLDNCVNFKERKYGHRVVVQNEGFGKCYSAVGYQKNEQMLNLGNGCRTTGVIQHEFIHALGFFHTQARSDRDKYITVLEKNIQKRDRDNFQKYGPRMIKHYGLPFDYGSIMMYGDNAFAKNPFVKTIKANDPTKQRIIGQRKGPSAGDIKMIRIAYGCEKL